MSLDACVIAGEPFSNEVWLLVCAHARAYFFNNRLRCPRFGTMRFGSSVVPLDLALPSWQPHTFCLSCLFHRFPFGLYNCTCLFAKPPFRVGSGRLFPFPGRIEATRIPPNRRRVCVCVTLCLQEFWSFLNNVARACALLSYHTQRSCG